MSQPSSSLHQHADELATSLPPLLLAADHTATRLMAGEHRRQASGIGYEFWQLRPWEHGENASRIDWRQSARREIPYIRQHEHTSTRVTWFWCADGPSMAWHSHPSLPEKRDRAQFLAMTLACLMQKAGHLVGLLPPMRQTPPQGRRGLVEMAARLERQSPNYDNSTPPPCNPKMCRYSTLLLIGDFLLPLKSLKQTFAPLFETFSAASCRGHVIQVLDPAEETLPFEGRVRLAAPGEPLNSECSIPSVAKIRETYRDRLAAHRQELKSLATHAGWTFTLHHTDQPPETTLLNLYGHLSGHATP